jgi:transcription-repair coupling factor (superfamily II helicase)
MESDTPMDRLVCGDVGFGKTEIAIRAAFKAAQTGKQVAILVPTTILAQQHYMTFKDRLHNYPIIVDVISRFRSAAEQKEIVSKTNSGKVDILIGTHRLLSKDIKFNDLGLLVIDEEHRFGVGAKEKLRELKSNIDTLTLTATPIPRTLNFSLMGARDLSVIETPPRNRLPIITEILMWDNEFLRKSINYEIDRGGQVFFVSDRVDDLEKIKIDLNMLLPHLRFGLAHGQMKSSELERTMEKFIEGKFDVLVTTKIVESGLDIPNANTIFINRSHKFGLAELYQLKGRVGRSNTQAYCYLLIPPTKNLSSVSLKRLQAIEEFSDLGSGFQLAMRDLEIRGAGNLLGPEQSGYINEIGFELYHKLLDEAVSELRQNEFADLFKNQITKDSSYLNNDEIQIELANDALLPGTYIESDKERFYYYKRLFDIKENADLLTLIEEINDKFGKAPKEAIELFFAVKLRISSLGTGFTKIEIKNRKLKAEFPEQDNIKFYENAFPYIIDYINTLNGAVLSQDKKKLILEIPLQNKSEAIEIMWRIKKSIELI